MKNIIRQGDNALKNRQLKSIENARRINISRGKDRIMIAA